jgi:hypothetical protein
LAINIREIFGLDLVLSIFLKKKKYIYIYIYILK